MSWAFFCLVLAVLDNTRLRYARRRRKLADAEMVAAALGPRVEVDGIVLPPHDDNWRWNDENLRLFVGHVSVDDRGSIYIGRRVPYMEHTPATASYCRDVWKAYRSRMAAQR